METIDATYRAVTPMFLGGADNESAEFRLPSFKGALRFWWRALAWRRLGGDLERIHREEARLFGSAASTGDADVGQAKFLLTADHDEPETIDKGIVLKTQGRRGSTLGDGARYFGYGVMETYSSSDQEAGELTRACIEPGFEFTVRLRLRPGLEDAQREQLERALEALGLFGGLGSKVRKGWGSIQLVDLNGERSTTTFDDFKSTFWDATSAITDEALGELPEYTAFSDKASTWLILGPPGMEPVELLDQVGREMIWYRSNGRIPNHSNQREVMGEPVEEENRPFWADHDLMARVAQQNRRADDHPARVAFGLPHNYFFSSSYDNANIEGSEHRRRSSPLFIHVHEMENGRPAVSVAFLPARFLPEGERIDVDGTEVPLERSDDFWDPVRGFLERLQSPQVASSFQQVLEFPI